ncbi:MAG: hypothetical protein ACT4NY_18055 [Pseudonocardiales bacterium]
MTTQLVHTGHLVHTDLRGIQRFVFASAQLRDVVGRSAMVRHIADPHDGPLADTVAEMTGVQVISAAGGHCVVLCPDEPTARDFACRYSGRLLRQCRELDPVMTLVPVTGPVAAVLRDVLRDRAVRVAGGWAGRAGIAGLTITEPCAVTGLPAERLHDPARGGAGPQPERVTAAVVATRELGRTRGARFAAELLDNGDRTRFGFPTQVDELGRSTGTRSMVGVAHLDLDGLGTRMATWLRSLSADVDLAVIRAAEETIDAFMTGLARHIVNTVGAAIDPTGPTLTGRPVRLGFPLSFEDDRKSRTRGMIMLPVRPVLVGGDDLTVLCDGRLAWSVVLAAFDYLAEPGNPPPKLRELGFLAEGERLTACAGLAVVSSGYPLSAAQEMVSVLCGAAKYRAKERVAGNRPQECHVSWHRGDHTADTLDTGRARVYSESDFRTLLREFLDPEVPTSLRGEHPPPQSAPGTVPWSRRRTWLRSRLGPLVERQVDRPHREAEKLLAETAHIHGRITLPADHAQWSDLVFDAIDLLDRHLHLAPTPEPEEQR